MDIQKYIDVGLTFSKDFVTNHGAQAWELVLSVTRIDGAGNLVVGFMCAIITVLFVRWHRDKWRAWAEEENPMCVFMVMFYIISGFIALVLLLDVWNWAMVFYPEAYLAHEAIQTVLSTK